MANKEIIFVKMLVEHGKSHATKNSVIDRTIALSHFHQAIELMIKLRIKEQNIPINFIEFERVLKALDPTTTTHQLKIPYWQDIFDLNRTRNNVYHNGLVHIPDEKTVYFFAKISENFMRDFFKQEYTLVR